MPTIIRHSLVASSITCGVLTAFYSQASSTDYLDLLIKIVLPLYLLQLFLGFLGAIKTQKHIIITVCVCLVFSGLFVLEMALRVFF